MRTRLLLARRDFDRFHKDALPGRKGASKFKHIRSLRQENSQSKRCKKLCRWKEERCDWQLNTEYLRNTQLLLIRYRKANRD